MPDLTLIARQQCASIDGPKGATVGGYHQWNLFSEHHYPQCTCRAYRYGKRVEQFGGHWYPYPCKHIREAQAAACGWHAEYDGSPAQTEAQEIAMICPRCGGPTVWVQIGV